MPRRSQNACCWGALYLSYFCFGAHVPRPMGVAIDLNASSKGDRFRAESADLKPLDSRAFHGIQE
ncbi:MAG: hypothetical protein KFF72_02465 [Arthrospira sp. SH-MAG29]|nr:hypothetical protein [Arthrospira sp. SH-MAG29]MBS0015231.1 hypothetical protein [Arthrospira sp. SH-MAG29]